VDERHRGRGIGRALIEAAIEQAELDGIRKLTLRVLGRNAPALALYAACGFVEEGRLRDAFLLEGEYVDDVLMSLTLPGRVS
jgi:RimJ/RimL family protein N-acetyltransferase